MSNIHLGPSEYCGSPPTIENADAGYTNKVPVGDSVLYSCKKGYDQVKDRVQLKCSLSDDYTSQWIGDNIECVSANQGNRIKN